MVFLNTWAFWLSGLVPAIVLLYLLKVRRRPLPVSTLLFWERVLQENRRRALFQRLRQWLSLLLHLIIFALVLLALARPLLGRLVRAGSSTVVVLDTRARMQAREPDGQTRLTHALAEVRRLARQAGADRQIAVIAGGAETSVAVPFTGDEPALLEALARVTATDASGSLEPALKLGRALLSSRAGAHEMVVLTDRPGPEEAGVSYPPIATARDNVAVTQFAARALPASSGTCEVLLELRNFGEQPAKGNVELSLDGQALDVRPYTLAPGAALRSSFPLVVPEAGAQAHGWLVAHLDARDALPLDDTAYATLPIRPPIPVLLVTTGNLFLEKLLAADPRVSFELLQPASFTPEIASHFQAVLLDDFVPPGLTLDELKGNLFFLGKTPFDAAEPPIVKPAITDTDPQSPLLRAVSLEQVRVARAQALSLPKESAGWIFTTPLRFTDRPLLVAGSRRTSRGEQRLAALAFRVLDSDLPLRVAFPLLVSNTVQWLAGANPAENAALKAGETLPMAAGAVVQLSPERPGLPPLAAAGEARGVFAPRQAGFYREQSAEGEQWIAVSPSAATEADLRTGLPAAPPIAVESAWWPRLPGWEAWPLWQWFALAALLLFTGEWWLFHRRRTE